MKAQAYLDMMKRQQQELTDFPIAYAFNEKQLEEALEKLGATKEECCTYLNIGRVIEVMPRNITFVKGIFQDYCWDEKGE